MSGIADHQSAQTTKLLLIGDSGAGKTGALASLAAAGYRLRIIDTDNGVDILRDYCTNPLSPYVRANPKIAELVRVVTVTDKMKSLNGQLVPERVTVWKRVLDLITEWKEPTGENLGKPESWGPQDILVVDSLSSIATAAYYFVRSMNGRLAVEESGNDWRRDIGSAQAKLRQFFSMITTAELPCNVILIAHVQMVREDGGDLLGGEAAGSVKGYPNAVGKALAPQIPRSFNNMLLAKTAGSGQSTKHLIYTVSQGVTAAKSSAPLRVKPNYPLDFGLAQWFSDVRGPVGPAAEAKLNPQP